MDSNKQYKHQINYPLLKINDDNISDYVIINDKYKKYIVKKGDLVIGTKGTCGNIRFVNVNIGYHKHGLLKITNINTNIISKQFLYYLIKIKFTNEFIKQNTNESVLSNMKKENIIKTIISIIKPTIMKEHKLEELFNEVDVLKEKLESNKNEYDIKLKELFKDFNIPEENIINNNNEEDIEPKIKQEVKQEKDNLLKLSLSQLKEKCKSLGITGYSKLNKSELIEKINNN